MKWAAATISIALACGSPIQSPTSEAGADESASRASRFVPGQTLRFAFDWSVESSAAMPGVLPGEVPVSGGLNLSGTMSLRVVEPTDEGSLVKVAFETLKTHEVSIMGENVLSDPEALLHLPAFLLVEEDGSVNKLYFEKSTPSLFRHLMTGLVAQTDLRIMPREQATRVSRVAGSAGLAEAEYSWSGARRLSRTLQRYIRFDGHGTGASPRVDGSATITLDEHDLPTRMESEEVVWLPDVIEEGAAFSSHSKFGLVLESSVAGPVEAEPVLADLLEHDMLGPPDDSEAQRVLAQRFAENVEPVDVVLGIRSAGNGLHPAPGFMIEATGLLRGWPELAAEFEAVFWSEDDPRSRALTIDLLASAGTPEAQAIVCRILGDRRLTDDPSLPGLIQRLSFLWRPMPETASFVLEQHDRARDGQRIREQAALLYPMGTIAGRIEAIDPLLTEALLTRIRDELGTGDVVMRAPALAGLGNAGAAADLQTLLAWVGDPDPKTRAQTGSSLRKYATKEATAALLAQLYDPDWMVSQMALSVLDAYHLSEADSEALAAIALVGGFSRELDGRMISALGRRRNDHPSVPSALLAMRERQDDPTERSRIDGILADR